MPQVYTPLPVRFPVFDTPLPPLNSRYSDQSCWVSSAPLVAAEPSMFPTAVIESLHANQIMLSLLVGVTEAVGVPLPEAVLVALVAVVTSMPEKTHL
jgi:hypothetical protein